MSIFIFSTKQLQRYAGIFHFRFWFGRWIEIVVDDRLPVRKNSPIYMRSASPVEMWPSLLEKAYAKAKGSYELLNRYLMNSCKYQISNIIILAKV